jgi:hypothetical protein
MASDCGRLADVGGCEVLRLRKDSAPRLDRIKRPFIAPKIVCQSASTMLCLGSRVGDECEVVEAATTRSRTHSWISHVWLPPLNTIQGLLGILSLAQETTVVSSICESGEHIAMYLCYPRLHRGNACFQVGSLYIRSMFLTTEQSGLPCRPKVVLLHCLFYSPILISCG